MFELITQVDADKVKKILTNTDLNEDINIIKKLFTSNVDSF